jgi:hypothetical protein
MAKEFDPTKFRNCKKSPNPDHVLMAVEDAVKVGEFELKGIGLWRLTMWSE